MNIEEYLNTDTFTSKRELMDMTGLNEREVRRHISNLKLVRPVIYNSKTRGHRLAKDISDLNTLHDIAFEYDAVRRCVADLEARKRVFNMQEYVYIKYLKEIENLFSI